LRATKPESANIDQRTATRDDPRARARKVLHFSGLPETDYEGENLLESRALQLSWK
jgi:hypothetical protein